MSSGDSRPADRDGGVATRGDFFSLDDEGTGMAIHRTDLRMRVEEFARSEVVTASPDAPVRDVARSMLDRSVGSVVIVADDEPVGIVTDRDLAVRLLVEEGPANVFDGNVDPADLTAADVMTSAPLVVAVGDELPRVLHHMNEAGARRVPVVDDDGAVAGIVTLDDVVIHLAGESTHVSAQLDDVAGVIRSESPPP